MRLRFWPSEETEEEFHQRMADLQRQMEELFAKSPDEVDGDPFECVYYMHQVSRSLVPGQELEVRRRVQELLGKFPLEPMARLVASSAYLQIGEEAEAIAQLGIALGLDPDHSRSTSTLLTGWYAGASGKQHGRSWRSAGDTRVRGWTPHGPSTSRSLTAHRRRPTERAPIVSKRYEQ